MSTCIMILFFVYSSKHIIELHECSINSTKRCERKHHETLSRKKVLIAGLNTKLICLLAWNVEAWFSSILFVKASSSIKKTVFWRKGSNLMKNNRKQTAWDITPSYLFVKVVFKNPAWLPYDFLMKDIFIFIFVNYLIVIIFIEGNHRTAIVVRTLHEIKCVVWKNPAIPSYC